MKKLPFIPSNSFVSISGGLDSIAAAYLLRTKHGLRKAYHFNHKLRPQNDEMEASVRKFCSTYDLDLLVCSAEKPLLTENDCRRARLKAFFDKDLGHLITAHHLDDAVESYLLNCFRGHPEYLPIPKESYFTLKYAVLHPFILFEKKDFENIARQRGLFDYIVEDETNDEVKGSRRNFIRKQIVPLLEEQKLGIKTIVKKRYESGNFQ